jgi:hypothetical protein
MRLNNANRVNWWSGSSEIDADFDAIGDGDGGDFLDLRSGALQIDVALIDGHFPVVPGLGSLTARSPSAADSEMFVGKTDGSWDLDGLGLGVVDELVGDLLHGGESVAREGDSGAFNLLVFETLLLVLVSHIY